MLKLDERRFGGSCSAAAWRLAGVMVIVLLAGCAHRRRADAHPSDASPQRRALDRLQVFVGRWAMDGIVEPAGEGEPMKLTGCNEARREGDGWLLVGTGRTRVGDLPINRGWAAWTYDASSDVYRCVMIDSSGAVGAGTARLDESTGTWHGWMVSEGPGGKRRVEGQIRFLNRDTKEEHWQVKTEQGEALFEVHKTERRR